MGRLGWMGGLSGGAGAIYVARECAREIVRRGKAGELGVTAARGPRGFTLLELLITLSVTTIGLVGLLALHQSVVRGNDGASRSAEAQQIGAATLESLRAQRIGNMMTALTGTSDPPLPTRPYETTVAGRGARTYKVTITVDAPPGTSTSLRRIRVVTSWTEDGGTAGANGGQLDHALALELVRTREEAP